MEGSLAPLAFSKRERPGVFSGTACGHAATLHSTFATFHFPKDVSQTAKLESIGPHDACKTWRSLVRNDSPPHFDSFLSPFVCLVWFFGPKITPHHQSYFSLISSILNIILWDLFVGRCSRHLKISQDIDMFSPRICARWILEAMWNVAKPFWPIIAWVTCTPDGWIWKSHGPRNMTKKRISSWLKMVEEHKLMYMFVNIYIYM